MSILISGHNAAKLLHIPKLYSLDSSTSIVMLKEIIATVDSWKAHDE